MTKFICGHLQSLDGCRKTERGYENFLQVNVFLDFKHKRKAEWKKKAIDLSRRESGEDNWYKSIS